MNKTLNKPLLIEQIKTMLRMQDDVNKHLIGDNWREKKHPFYRAIWTESAELMDHIGWKWWKKQESDMKQARLEIVDIWHFGLSCLLQHSPYLHENNDIDSLAQLVANDIEIYTPECPTSDFYKTPEAIQTAIESFVEQVVKARNFHIRSFMHLCSCMDMDMDYIHKLYVGKATLNKFRQDYGYKDGTYQKTWQGLEDNECLYQILENTDYASEDLEQQIYNSLKSRYEADVLN